MMALVSVSLAQEAEKININKASAVELTQLKRIGPKLSQRIVEYREKHGPFERPGDIMQVRGIGPKTFELNKDRITTE
jgi:competence protein ComEA